MLFNLIKKQYENKKLLQCKNENYQLFTFNNQEKICKIVDVYDGDSFTACFYYDNKIIKYKFRANGYDSPEMRPRLDKVNRNQEIIKAKQARDKFIELSDCNNNLVKIQFHEFDKYGRILATVYNISNKTNVNQLMIDNNFGYSYHGGTKLV